MQIPDPIPLQSESALHPTQMFELQMGVVGVPLQSLFARQPTHVPFAGVPLASFAQTGFFVSFVAQAVAPAVSHPSQVPVSRLQIGVWGVVQWVSRRQLTHIPFIKVAVAVVTQTGLLASFVAHALESAHAWHVPVDRLQIGAWGVVLQSLFERQLTHIPGIGPASPATQSGRVESNFWHALESVHFSQLLAAMLQMGVASGQKWSAHEKGGKRSMEPSLTAPPSDPPPPTPPSAGAQYFIELHVYPDCTQSLVWSQRFALSFVQPKAAVASRARLHSQRTLTGDLPESDRTVES
jgi:hypothetical protein